VLDDGTVVLVYIRRAAHYTTDGELHIKLGANYGASWSDEDKDLEGNAVSGFPIGSPDVAAEDPGEPFLIQCPNGDLLCLMWGAIVDSPGTVGCWQSRSVDDGLSWDTPAQVIIFGDENDVYLTMTEDYFVLDGVIYCGARLTGGTYYQFLATSDDNGVSWSFVSWMETADDASMVEVGMEYVGDDTIVAIFRSTTATYRKFSYDLGLTWSAQETIAIPPSGRHRIKTLAHLQNQSNWENDPRLIMNGFTFEDGGDRRNALWYSPNGGKSWSFAPLWVDEATGDAGYGATWWNPNSNQICFASYQGSRDAASIKLYRVRID
jgi:hypothetical protein